MSTSQNFTNEFRVRQVPQTLDIISIFHDQQRYKGTKFDYSASALAAAEMTRITGKPFASLGASVVTISGSTAPKMVKVIVKANGMPVDTVITSGAASAISPDAQGYLESLSRLINRQINVAMIGAGFRQNGRHFFGQKPVELGSIFHMFRGAYISAKAFSAKSALVIVDPAVEYRSSHTLLDALKNELKRRGIQNWRDASEVSGEINASFSSRAARLRSVYSEVVGSHADPEYNVYRFGQFDFSAGVGDGVDQTRSPLSFHKRFGREVSPDQPVVRVFAKGGFEVSHAPKLLEVQPSTESLKRVSSQFSKKAAAMALMNSQDRYYSSIEYASPLVASGLIEKEPRRVAVQYCGPVVLAVEDDYINVKTNLDFRKFYKKGKVLVKPIIESFHVFHNAHDSPLALPLIKTIGQVFSEFVVNLPNPHFHSDSPDDPNEFSNYLIDSAMRERLGRHDLVVAIDDMNDPSADELYNRVKGFSLFDQVFPTQFFETASIEAQMEKDLKSNLVYSAFPKIVANLGLIPFGLRPGFAPPGTVFIGLD